MSGGWVGEASMSSPGSTPFQGLHLPWEVLWTQASWAFKTTSLCRSTWLNHWPLEIEFIDHPLCPALRSGGGTQSCNHRIGSPSNQPPSLGVVQKSPLTQQKTLLMLSSQKIPREIPILEVCARSGDKDQTYIYYKSIWQLGIPWA